MGTYCITCKNNECDNRNKPIYFGLDCEKYFNNGYINADRIREMNDEELAQWLYRIDDRNGCMSLEGWNEYLKSNQWEY